MKYTLQKILLSLNPILIEILCYNLNKFASQENRKLQFV